MMQLYIPKDFIYEVFNCILIVAQVAATGLEELPGVRGQWWPGGDTPCPTSGEARRSHLAPEARGSDLEEPP